MHPTQTDELLKRLKSISTVNDLNDFTEATQLSSPAVTFNEYLSEKIVSSSLSTSEVIHASQIQRNYAYQILNGSKNPSRDKVLALCLALCFSLEDTQRALTLAGCALLYPKKRRDSALIFAVNKHLSVQETNELLYEIEESILE